MNHCSLLLKHQATPNDHRLFYRCDIRLQLLLRVPVVRWRLLWFKRWSLILGGMYVIY